MLIRPLAATLVAALLATAATAQVPWTVETYGPNCGPLASGTVTPVGAHHRVAYTLTQAIPHSHAVFILGLARQSLPIHFGMPCLLQTELGFTQVHQVNAYGSYTWSRAMPSWFQGSFCVQFVDVTFSPPYGLLVRTSNGVETRYTP